MNLFVKTINLILSRILNDLHLMHHINSLVMSFGQRCFVFEKQYLEELLKNFGLFCLIVVLEAVKKEFVVT